MKKYILASALSSVFAIPVFAADLAGDEIATIEERMTPQSFLEFSVWGGKFARSGDALSTTGQEGDNFSIGGVDIVGAMPIGSLILGQIELRSEKTSGIDGIVQDDIYDGNWSAGGQLAIQDGPILVGIFGAKGEVYNTDVGDADNQDANFTLVGVGGRIFFDNLSIAAQGGRINSDSEDAEHFDDARFVRGIGQYFFNDGRTKIQADITKLEGTQDYDSVAGADPLELLAWGVEVEHAFSQDIFNGTLSIFGSYRNTRVVENSASSGPQTLQDDIVYAGLRWRFGALTPLQRAQNSAPDMPNVGRWLGLTPAVD